MLAEFLDRRSRYKNRLAISLLDLQELIENIVLVVLLFLKQFFDPLEKNISIHNLLISFFAVHIVALAYINHLGARLRWLCLGGNRCLGIGG